MLFCIACMAITIYNRKCEVKSWISKFIICDYVCSTIMLLNTTVNSGKITIILIFMLFLPTLMIYLSGCSKEEIRNILFKFVKIVSMICMFSFIMWILFSILHIMGPTNTINVVWAKPYSTIDSYFFVHFDVQYVTFIFENPIIRNTGIFTEGPMFAFVIIIAMLINNSFIINNKRKVLYNIILLITMISTFSFTGIICVLVIFIYNIIKRIIALDKDLRKKFIVIISVIIVVLMPLIIVFSIKKIGTSSASHRETDIINGLQTFIESPIVGKGINHERLTELDYEVGYGYSNSIIPILTDGGLFLLFVYIMPMILLIYKSIKERQISNLPIILIYMIILFSTLVQYRMLLLLLLGLIFVKSCDDECFKEDK